MSTYSVTELHGLDGKKFAEAWFDRPSAIGASWGWVVSTLSSRFECSEDEIDCEEPADDDEEPADDDDEEDRQRKLFPEPGEKTRERVADAPAVEPPPIMTTRPSKFVFVDRQSKRKIVKKGVAAKKRKKAGLR